jgi:hypothetical protein
MMTDKELAAMANDFVRHPGSVFTLEIVHGDDSGAAHSRAYVSFDPLRDRTRRIH